jgi:tyrosine-specific transport protein
MIASIDMSKVPLFVDVSCSNVASVISVVFTSFGFQIILHIIRDYIGKDAKALKKSLLFGVMIPAVVYILWTCGVLSVLYNSNEAFYHEMVYGNVEVGDVIQELSKISGLPNFQILVWWISIFAIFTSIIGVSLGLVGSVDSMIGTKINIPHVRKIVAALITVIPAYLIAIIVPNAFIKVFRFAGAILSIIAILLPAYLIYKAKLKDLYYRELDNKLLLALSILFGACVIAIEMFIG